MFSILPRLIFLLVIILPVAGNALRAQHGAHTGDTSSAVLTESDYYSIQTIHAPEGVLLEVGGMEMLPDGRLAVCTRRGEVWLLENPSGRQPWFNLFASGLHEPLGLAWKEGSLYAAQRAELTRLTDTNGDDMADLFESVCIWPLSGNYCEYNHGPVIGPDGNFYINMNLGDNGMRNKEPFYGEMGSHAEWRGWMVRISTGGRLQPYAAGLRSPAGIGLNAEGDIFYTENQGGWIGTGYISHVKEGDFFGHPSSLKSADEPGSTVRLGPADIPRDAPMMHEAAREIPGLKLPSVRFPHGILGISTAGFIADTAGAFGPFFKDQLFVGDEGHANMMRVFLEKVNGEYQGAVFPFKQGFISGILRMEWGNDGSLFVGMSDRGWNSIGPERSGLQRLAWTGKTPFEIQAIKAKPDGFELEFTLPVDRKAAEDPGSYAISSFDYLYHMTYGSEVQDKKDCWIKAIKLSADRRSVRLVLDEVREGYIHEVKCEGIRSENGLSLLHNFGYYSLNLIPSGNPLDLSKSGLVLVKEESAIPDTSIRSAQPGQALAREKAAVTGRSAEKRSRSLAKRTTEMPSSWTNGPDHTFIIGTRPGLKFDREQLRVKPGDKVRLVFRNNDDMQHNLLLVSPGAADEIGKQALNLGLDGAAMHYVPESAKVLYHTNLLQPHSEETIYFVAPEKEGRYPYVCTYPGHYLIMRGILNVKR